MSRPSRARASLVVGVLALSACAPVAHAADGAVDLGPAEQVRLGYFATVTHAPALVGLERGFFADELGETELTTQVFGAGPAAIEALDAGAIDAAFVGPNPAISAYLRSDGASLRIVSGAASGGAQLVVRDGIDVPGDLVGATLASPQLGGTQDVALRTWLAEEGLESRLRGGGDVTITPTSSALTLQLFREGTIDGAWLPEPWASRLVVDAGAHVLVDERELWPGGQFPTTYLVVSTRFLAEHPDDRPGARERDGGVGRLDHGEPRRGRRPGQRLARRPDGHAAERRPSSNGPSPRSPSRPTRSPRRSRSCGTTPSAAGTSPDAPIDHLLDLGALNAVRSARGEPPVSDAGLGQG